MSGSKAVIQLAELATNFLLPRKGRDVRVTARTDETGIVSLPPKPPDALPGTCSCSPPPQAERKRAGAGILTNCQPASASKAAGCSRSTTCASRFTGYV